MVVLDVEPGTVVLGERVRLRPAAVAHGSLQIHINTAPQTSQPQPFSTGETKVTHVSEVKAQEQVKPVVGLQATATVDDLVKALNQLGASPRDLIAILQALKAAGALDAELEVL